MLRHQCALLPGWLSVLPPAGGHGQAVFGVAVELPPHVLVENYWDLGETQTREEEETRSEVDLKMAVKIESRPKRERPNKHPVGKQRDTPCPPTLPSAAAAAAREPRPCPPASPSLAAPPRSSAPGGHCPPPSRSQRTSGQRGCPPLRRREWLPVSHGGHGEGNSEKKERRVSHLNANSLLKPLNLRRKWTGV